MGLFKRLFRGTKAESKTSSSKTHFNVSDSLLDEDAFWAIVHASNTNSFGDYDRQQKELEKELEKLTPDEIILFGNRFRYFRNQANTWELWGAIYIIHGGCGDDSFNDFREWVIGQGKDFYYRTTNDPETLVDVDAEKIEDVDWEGLGYVPGIVFERLTGQEMPHPYQGSHETTGKEWTEEGDDLKQMFPRLAAKYFENLQ